MRKKLPSSMSMAASALRRISRASVFCLALSFGCFSGFAQSEIIEDVNVEENPYPIEYSGLTDGGNGNFYFISQGKELWKSNTNEQPQHTVLLKVMRRISSLTVSGGNVYFVGEDGAGRELWKTNGTGATTRKVKEIRSGSAGSNPMHLTDINGVLYFSANDGTTGYELWKSDGTAEGTVRVKDIYPGSTSSEPKWMTNVNGVIYFSAADPTMGTELWKTDGTEAGTVAVKDIYPGATASGAPAWLASLNDMLLFEAQDNTGGRELWKSNGTAAGTVRIKDIYPGVSSSGIRNITPMGNFVYFSANDGVHGTELWKSNGTGSATVLVADYSDGAEHAAHGFSHFKVINNYLYYTALYNDEYYMFRTRGTVATTTHLQDALEDLTDPHFTLLNGKIYFVRIFFDQEAYSPFLELFKMNPDGTGLTLVKRFYHYFNMEDDGQDPLIPELVNVNNALYLFGILNEGEGYKMLKSDGTAAGTVILKDTYMPTKSSNPDLFTTQDGVTFFRAHGRDGRYQSVWRTGGLNGNTFALKDMQDVVDIRSIGNIVYFVGISMEGNWQLWKTDGTVSGTVLLKQLDIGFGYYSNLIDVNGTAYFANAAGELWISNGTPTGTRMLKDFHMIVFIAQGGDRALFTVQNSAGGLELWRSNGTTNGTSLIKTIHRGEGPALSPGTPRTTVNNILYFAAPNAANDYEIWRSDATASGTYMMKDLRKDDASDNDIQSMVAFRDSLYFCAKADLGAYALYKSDGTGTGTKQVTHISPVHAYMPLNDQLLMLMHDIYTTGLPPQLWTTNGSAAGTRLIKELTIDADGWFGGHQVVNNTIYFSMQGQYLWRTDGTECGTFTLDTPPKPYPLIAVGTDLIFGAQNPYYGKEPHRLSTLATPGNPCGDQQTSVADAETTAGETPLVVAYAPNPFTDQLVFRVNGTDGELADVQVKSFAGHIIDHFPAMQTNTDHAIGAGWPKGMYVLKVITSKRTDVVRVIKK